MPGRHRLVSLMIAAAVVLAALAMPVAPRAQEGVPTANPDPERGRRLYYEHACYGCHGYNGQTGAHDLVGTDSVILNDAEAFTLFLRLRADVVPLFPSVGMPSYPETSLDDQAARDIFAWIRTFELDAPEVEDVPALRAVLESAGER